MDDVITRIIEVERESARDIERAETDSRTRIEAHRRTLEEEKERAHTLIITTENARLTQTLQTLNQQTREASLSAGKNYESVFQDTAKIEAVKEKIVNIFLAE